VGSIPTARSSLTEGYRTNDEKQASSFALYSSAAHIAQSVEHFLGKEEVIGPIPIVGTSWVKEY
jgi:hypothetical protein